MTHNYSRSLPPSEQDSSKKAVLTGGWSDAVKSGSATLQMALAEHAARMENSIDWLASGPMPPTSRPSGSKVAQGRHRLATTRHGRRLRRAARQRQKQMPMPRRPWEAGGCPPGRVSRLVRRGRFEVGKESQTMWQSAQQLARLCLARASLWLARCRNLDFPGQLPRARPQAEHRL